MTHMIHTLKTLCAAAVVAVTVSYGAVAQDQGSVRAIQAQAVKSTVQFETLRAATEALINPILTCNSLQKFYSPTDAAKDADGCVGSTAKPDILIGEASVADRGIMWRDHDLLGLSGADRTDTTKNIIFPKPFSSIPQVHVFIDGFAVRGWCTNSGSGWAAPYATNITTTGFRVILRGNNGGCGFDKITSIKYVAIPQ
jgi:hypothetical protein